MNDASERPDDRRLFVNRELSLLAFQWRVLEEARDPANPVLERLRFLSIVASNLDEFFMVRVAGLKQQIAAGVTEAGPDGLTPVEAIAQIRRVTLALARALNECLHTELIPAMAAAGVHLLDFPQLNDKQLAHARAYFEEMVFPVLTPLAFDPGRPFPHISNLSLNLGVLLEVRRGIERFARIKVPNTLPRLVALGRTRDPTSHPQSFVWIEQLIAANLDRLFPDLEVREVQPFHVTRDNEMELQELDAEDLLETIEHGVRRRRFGSVVRLLLTPGTSDRLRDLLVHELKVSAADVYAVEAPLALSNVAAIVGEIDRPDLKFPSFVPRLPPRLVRKEEDDLFSVIRGQDVLLHHPFESFAPVVEFLRLAARDPDVLAIKQTLYRVGRNSPVVAALLEAVQNRKQVAVLVELKARFDEESNIGWARTLEAEGVHVIYGLLGYKTHSKVGLIIRREGDRLTRYVHLATGNYNAITAVQYTDLGLFTVDHDIAEDATQLFNYLTGYSKARDYRTLLVAPFSLRERLLALIAREVERRRAGHEAHLIFKVNALVDRQMIEALVAAARDGVRVDLLVRGICCLRPGIPGLSEGVSVTSIVGRFLEHSRIYWFRNGGDEEIYLGSADLMPRNLDRRVEVLFPVKEAALVRYLRHDVLETYLRDNVRARRMRPDGTYERARPAPGEPAIDSQLVLLGVRAPR